MEHRWGHLSPHRHRHARRPAFGAGAPLAPTAQTPTVEPHATVTATAHIGARDATVAAARSGGASKSATIAGCADPNGARDGDLSPDSAPGILAQTGSHTGALAAGALGLLGLGLAARVTAKRAGSRQR